MKSHLTQKSNAKKPIDILLNHPYGVKRKVIKILKRNIYTDV